MRKTRDILYTIFMGLILFISGAIILGGIEFFISMYIGIDFVSVILFFILTRFLTNLVLKGIESRGLFYSIYLPLMVVLMFLLKDYVFFLVYYILGGVNILTVLSVIPELMLDRLISYFVYTSEIGIGNYIINLFYGIIDILILIIGVYQSYKITKYR